MHITDQWQSLAGSVVEVRIRGELYRHGLVDAAMADASGFWLAAHGADTREFIHVAFGYQVWTSLYPRSSKD
jgi:hypothetical protein